MTEQEETLPNEDIELQAARDAAEDEERETESFAEEEQYTTNSPTTRQRDVALLDTETEEAVSYPLGNLDELDIVSADRNSDAVMADIEDYTGDEETLDDFADRQQLSSGGNALHRRLREHHAETPDLSADDIDAAWDQSDVGEETASGSTPTPDRDQVDEIGEGVGLTYEDDEPLDFVRKVWSRDDDRWELNPASAEDDLDEEA